MKRRTFLRSLAGSGLAATATPLLAAGGQQTIGGRVTSQSKPLAGVLVSDGRSVTRTDDQGRYELTIGADSGRFVFVTTPRGYWTDAFYRPLATALQTGADFVLDAVEQPDRFDIAFIADMHITKNGPALAKTKASIREINGLNPTPALLWAQGDICLQGGVGDGYMECMNLAKMPTRNGAGNHEMMLKHENPRDDYERLFGPTYYSFDIGGVHCIVLDGNKPIPGDSGWQAVHGTVEGSELAWLKADLAAQPKGKPIIVGIHIPIVSTCPERRNHSPKGSPCWEITNDRELTDLFSRYGVRLVLQGHMHENERISVGGVEYVESISLCGCWFQSGAGFERGVDNVPRGYRIVSVDGDKITHRYRSSCESYVDRQGEFVGLERPIPRHKETPFVFNCYDAPNVSTAQARIDQGPWQPMPAFAAVNEKLGLKMCHHYRLLSDTTDLTPGSHHVEARVTWPDGTVVSQRQPFTLTG